ncbi:hypothetical protein NQ318_005581 [Aromia moschata]|uniref:Uncharacterized protein n=1 Tax=Aromia moschata TaxID=1265417 RepID=A0AAV8XIS2_9CUCU|nr:hypothetical protein NQ318_005581 [Aromia moschata]
MVEIREDELSEENDILPLIVITTVQRENTHGKDVGHTTKPCDRCQLPQAGFEPAQIIALGVIAIWRFTHRAIAAVS